MYSNRKYVIIINASEVSSIDFSKVLETSADTLKYSIDNTKTFIKYEGDKPSFLDGKTEYTYEEILTELTNSDWTSEL